MDYDRYNQDGDDRDYAKTSGAGRRNKYRNDQEVDLDDINLEENNDIYDDQLSKQRSGISNTNASNKGRPSKINSYMDRFGENLKNKVRKSIDDNGANMYSPKTRKDMSMDDSFGSPRIQANNEADLKNLMKDMNEMAHVHDEVQTFEKNFYNGKKKINNCDMLSLETDVTSKALLMQYQILSDLLAPEDPKFDQQKMDSKINNITQKVKSTNKDYEKFKGEFLAVNEPIINKDMMVFKIDRVQKNREKQEKLLMKMPDQEVAINENAQNLDIIRGNYEEFEKNLFEKKNVETQYIIQDTVQLMEKIQQKQDSIEDLIETAKTDLSFVVPQTREQRKKLEIIYADIQSIDKRIKKSIDTFDKNCDEKSSLDIKHDICLKILKNIRPQDDLTSALQQSRKLSSFVDQHKQQLSLNKKLKMLLDEEVLQADLDLQRVLQDAKKFVDGVKNARKDEYDDLMRQITKLAKKVSEDLNYEDKRINSFENNIMNPNKGKDSKIPDGDMMFLTKEIGRYRSAIISSQTVTEEVLVDSQQIQPDRSGVEVEDLKQLQQNLKSLQKQDGINVPRIKANIDQLEAFTLQSLKNQLNDENKKSQHMISQMKKNYEDLQKTIDNLNNKITKTGGEVNKLKANFQNDDLERENEVFNRLEDTINDCEKETNGDRKKDLDLDQISLQAKKKVIIAAINKCVNQFNENNKLIKESNKKNAAESDIVDLLLKNKEVQENCTAIDDKIVTAKDQASDIDKRLNLIIECIPEIKEKYDAKNQSIDECDELFDKANAQIDRLGNVLVMHIEKTQDIIKKVEGANPINNPSASGKQNDQFLRQVSNKLEESHQMLNDLESFQEVLNKTRDDLIDCVQPLNELGEREVKQPEIEKILRALDKIIEDLMNQERDILPRGSEIDKLQKEVDDLLDSQKIRKLEQAQEKLNLLDSKLQDLEKIRDRCKSKLEELKDLMSDAKHKGKEDPELMQKLKEYESESRQIEKDLKDCSDKIQDLKRRKNDHQSTVSKFDRNHDSFTPGMVDDILADIDECIEQANFTGENLTAIEAKLDDMLIELRDYLDTSLQRQEYLRKIKIHFGDMYENLIKFKELSEKLPPQIEMMLETLKEMKIGSEPDDSADYWDERNKISTWTVDLKKTQADLTKYLIIYRNHQQQFEKEKLQMSGISIEALKRLYEQVKATHEEIDSNLQDTFDCQDEVNRIKKEMGECEIAVNIAVRKNELQAYDEKLERIIEEFQDLKKADMDYKGDKNSEDSIQRLIKKLEGLIRNASQDKREHFKFLQNPLENYSQKDYVSLKNYTIIIEIREFKFRIEQSFEKLKEIEELMGQLNHELILQDMENATKILRKKIAKLRERLLTTKEELVKISNCGEEMDGNTTVNEEDEFIDALKDEMPEVFKNIEGNFDQLDGLEFLLKEVIETQNIDKMKQLKKEVDDATNKVEQSESLSTKLENEIIEWNVVKKLCTRDEELIEIDTLLLDFDDDLKGELSEMERELIKNQNKLEKDGDPQGELQALRNGINSYVKDIDELMGEVQDLKEKRDQCFGEFDNDIPSPIKVERVNRINHMGDTTSPRGLKMNKKMYMNTASDKPVDMFYMITVNCRYKKRIHALLRELRNINQKRRELQDKYAPLKRDLNHVKVVKMYKAVKGDAIDELFAYHLNKAQLNLPVKRVTAGKYMFGTRQILAKIINGKLVIRVGGGYMGADEFIEQYGRIELLKMMKAEGQNVDQEIKDLKKNPGGGRAGSTGRGSIGMNQMKALMKNTLLANVKTYTTDGQHDKVSQGRQSMAQLEQNFDVVSTALSTKNARSPGNVRNSEFGKMGMNRVSSADKIGFQNQLGSPGANKNKF